MARKSKEESSADFKDYSALLGEFEYDGSDASFDLTRYDPSERRLTSGDKLRDQAHVQALASELDALQNVFYADRRFKLLIVLQGTDTSGKDGTIRGVFGRMSPLGVHTMAWNAPTDDQRRHDFLWRIHRHVPATGEIAIFNRSHYEDVLVPVVDGSIDAAETARRYRQINDFERLLCETGTVVLKFLLHISKDEQRERLQKRLGDPAKRWKFEVGDLDARAQWDAYQRAYGATIAATATPCARWTIVPADSKTHRNLVVATAVRKALLALRLRYPEGDASLAKLRVE